MAIKITCMSCLQAKHRKCEGECACHICGHREKPVNKANYGYKKTPNVLQYES